VPLARVVGDALESQSHELPQIARIPANLVEETGSILARLSHSIGEVQADLLNPRSDVGFQMAGLRGKPGYGFAELLTQCGERAQWILSQHEHEDAEENGDLQNEDGEHFSVLQEQDTLGRNRKRIYKARI
jgi:hypothetical protein